MRTMEHMKIAWMHANIVSFVGQFLCQEQTSCLHLLWASKNWAIHFDISEQKTSVTNVKNFSLDIALCLFTLVSHDSVSVCLMLSFRFYHFQFYSDERIDIFGHCLCFREIIFYCKMLAMMSRVILKTITLKAFFVLALRFDDESSNVFDCEMRSSANVNWA